MIDLVGLPKTLEIDARDCFLKIENHKITEMMMDRMNLVEIGHDNLIDFVVACINSKNNWVFAEMQSQGLGIDALVEKCVWEIKYGTSSVFDVMESNQFANLDGTGMCSELLELDVVGSDIRERLDKDYVESGKITKQEFYRCWQDGDYAFLDFRLFISHECRDIISDCVKILQKTKSYDTLQKELLPIIKNFEKKWENYLESNIRRVFAEQLKRSGEDHD